MASFVAEADASITERSDFVLCRWSLAKLPYFYASRKNDPEQITTYRVHISRLGQMFDYKNGLTNGVLMFSPDLRGYICQSVPSLCENNDIYILTLLQVL